MLCALLLLLLLLHLPLLLILNPLVRCPHLHYHHRYLIKDFQKQSKAQLISSHLISSHLISSHSVFANSPLSPFFTLYFTYTLLLIFILPFLILFFHSQLFCSNPCNYVFGLTSYFLTFVSFFLLSFLFFEFCSFVLILYVLKIRILHKLIIIFINIFLLFIFTSSHHQDTDP